MEHLMILASANSTAYAIGEIIGMMIPIGIVVLIVWGIIKAISKKKVKQ